MREAFVIGHLEKIYARLDVLTKKAASFSHVLEEIIGKELMRGQALHKVLMDKKLFTDEELKKALEQLIAESKAELEKLEKEAKEAKQKAVEILVPAGTKVAETAPEQSIPTEKKDDVPSVPPAPNA